jgi:catechol 2,3-dioxygenase-like lactoylglutathione lyase family enzyme
MSKAITRGVHHVGLAVPDLETAQSFFVDLLGWAVVGKNLAYPAIFVSDGTVRLTLWQLADPKSAVAFNRRTNVGLHHLALKVASRADLQATYERVKACPEVVTEFSPEPISQGSQMHHFICAMPGGIRIEFAEAAE